MFRRDLDGREFGLHGHYLVELVTYLRAICLTLAIAVLIVGCATTLGERGHWSKQEQDRFLRTGK